MARTRLAEPGFFLNERLAGLPPHARLLYIGLWQIADREGRLEDRPRRIHKEIFPWEELDVDELLWMLASREGLGPKDDAFIVRYEAEGVQLIAIPRFLKHQKPHLREVKSILPAPAKGKIRSKEGTPKADLGHALGTPKADLARNGAVSEEGSTQGTPSANLRQTQALPRRPVTDPVTDPVSVSVSDPDPDPRARAKDEQDDQVELPRGLEPLVAYVRETWPEIPTPRRAAKAWADANPGMDLLAVAKEARAHEVSMRGEKRYEIPAALLNKFFRNARVATGGGNGAPIDPTESPYTADLRARTRAEREQAERDKREAKLHPPKIHRQPKN